MDVRTEKAVLKTEILTALFKIFIPGDLCNPFINVL